MKFLRKLLRKRQWLKPIWDNKVTINPDTNQYHLVVFLTAGGSYIYLLPPLLYYLRHGCDNLPIIKHKQKIIYVIIGLLPVKNTGITGEVAKEMVVLTFVYNKQFCRPCAIHVPKGTSGQ